MLRNYLRTAFRDLWRHRGFSLLNSSKLVLKQEVERLPGVLSTSMAGWGLIEGWLKGFAYRIPVYWWIFALAALLAVAIAVMTVSFQALKAALVNPVRSLRTE